MIASDAPLVAALIGLLVESSGGQPLFPVLNESLSEAIARLRPVSLALVGVRLIEVRSDLFFALAERHGIRVVIFGPNQELREIADVVSRRGVAWFSLPPTQRGIDVAIHSSQDRRAPVSEGRRRDAQASVAGDGTPLLVDQLGTHWLVYDRRASTERRQSGRVVDRMFVSEQGERFSCDVDATIANDTSAFTLVHQLHRAQADSDSPQP